MAYAAALDGEIGTRGCLCGTSLLRSREQVDQVVPGVAKRLCKMDRRYKFTLELTFLDTVMMMKSLKLRRGYNEARRLQGYVTSSGLSLSWLEVRDLSHVKESVLLVWIVAKEDLTL